MIAVACVSRDITRIVQQRSEADQLIDASLDIFCTINEQGNFVFVSAASKNHWGYLPEELIGTPYVKLIVEEDLPKTTEIAAKILDGQDVKSFVNRYKRRDGGIAYNSWSVRYDEHAQLMYCVVRDAQEKIKQEEKILQSEQRFKALVQEGSDLIGILDELGNYSYVSPTSTTILGISPEEFLGRNALEFVHPDDVERTLESLQKITTNDTVTVEPFRFQNHKKEWRWIETVLTNMLDNPAVNGIVANSRDITERRKLKELNLQVGQMAKIGGWELDLLTMKPSFSEETYRIYGLPYGTPPKLEDGMKFYAIEAQPIIQEAVAQAIENHKPYDIEVPFINANKKNIWVRTQGEVEVVNGKSVRLYGTIQDITDRKEAEEEKNNLQDTIENSLNEIYVFDTDSFHFKYINRGALLNLGYTEQEIKTLTPLDLKPEYDLNSFKKLITPLVKGEKEKIIFFTNHKRKNDSLYPAEVHLQLITEGNNKRFLAIVLDITARKKAEEENKFKANLLKMIGQSAIATDLDGVVNYWNKAAEDIYGWKKEEALGENIKTLTTPDTSQVQAREIMEQLKNGKTWAGEFNVRKKEGTIFPARVTNSPIYDENHKLSGIIGISSDISEEVKNKELLAKYTDELERSNEELEQFAFIVSHDLQEPLRMVTGFMDQLKRKYEEQLDEKAHQYIYYATDGAKRMKQIILDILTYSRAGRINEGEQEVNLNEVLDEFKQLRRNLIAESNATIKASELPILHISKASITQVLHCLLDNALKYSEQGTNPVVEIKVTNKEKEWVFSVKDNGIGIDPKFYNKIFVMFQRLHNRDKFTGTGIGLSIAKRHIEYLGGSIWLESELGKGTTFYFTIPKNK